MSTVKDSISNGRTPDEVIIKKVGMRRGHPEIRDDMMCREGGYGM
jgi:hypothetical protein